MKTIIMMIIIPTQMTTDGEGRKKFVNKNIKTVLVKFLLSRSSILSPHRIRVGVAMTQSSAPVVLAAGAGAERASTPKWARRSLWVVAGLGLIAVLVFQFENELVNLNAYGRRYLTGDRAPHKPGTLFENTPRDVVVESSEGVKPPMAPQEHTEQPPPPANAVPSGEDSDTAASSEEASGQPPAPSLEEWGWAAWPPPNPPPAGGSTEAEPPATTAGSPPPLGPKTSEETSPDSESKSRLLGYDGWDAKVGWPPSSQDTATNSASPSSGKNAREPERNTSQDTNIQPERNSQPEGEGEETAKQPPSPSLEEWGWVGWPPPAPPPPSR